jgi:hypothetical protein
MSTPIISEQIKQVCRLYEHILSSAALADMYSTEVKEMVAEEVRHLLSYEQPNSRTSQLFEAYLQLLKEE